MQFKVTKKMLTIDNARYVKRTSRQFCSPFLASAITNNCRSKKTMRDDDEDLEQTYNLLHYNGCEIAKRLLDGPGNGKKLNNLVYNRLLSHLAIQKRMNSY